MSAVASTSSELKSLRGAASTPEFLSFSEAVNGCEFLGEEMGAEVTGDGFSGAARGLFEAS